MGVVVDVFFYLEGSAGFFHLDAHLYVEVHLFGCCFLIVFAVFVELGVVSVLDVVAFVDGVCLFVDAELAEGFVHVFLEEVLAGEVYHGACVASLIDDE